MRRALVLRALPVYLHEDASKFFRTCNVSVLASLSIPLPSYSVSLNMRHHSKISWRTRELFQKGGYVKTQSEPWDEGNSELSIPEGYSRKQVQQTLSLTLNSELTFQDPLSHVVEVEGSTSSCSSTQQNVRTQMCVKQHLLVVKLLQVKISTE